MKKLIICFLVLPFFFNSCTPEVKTNDIYTEIKNDPLFQEYIKRFKSDNKIFGNKSIYFNKIKNKKYLGCYMVLFGSESCDFKDHEKCVEIEHDSEFIGIVENQCKKGKLMIELKEKYPEMDKKMVAKLIEGSYENGFASEMLNIKGNNKK